MVNQTELRMAMTACATGYCRLHGIKPPPDGTLHSLAKEAFLHQVSYLSHAVSTIRQTSAYNALWDAVVLPRYKRYVVATWRHTFAAETCSVVKSVSTNVW